MSPDLGYFADLLGSLQFFIDRLIPILIGLALLVFFWGLFNYVRQPEEADKGKKVMIAGLIGLFVMVSVWGIINLAQDIFNVDNDLEDIRAPQVPR